MQPTKMFDTVEQEIVQTDQFSASAAIDSQQQASVEPDRPWTPSYSVSRQGTSPVSSAKELDDLEEQPSTGNIQPVLPISIVVSAETVEEPSTLEDVEPQLTTETGSEPAFEEVPERPWTPSYSVTRQGSSPALAPKVLEDVPSEERPGSDMAAENVPERPWTPSYSVIQHGQSPRHSPKPLYEEPVDTPLESPAVLPPQDVTAETVPEGSDAPGVSERPWTPSYSVTRQGSSPGAIASELPEDPTADNKETPQRPWTPSYSVSRQGTSPLAANSALPQVSTDAGVPIKAPIVRTPSISLEAEPDENTPDASAREHTEEQHVPAWTASYSVSRQGSSHGGSPVPQTIALEAESLTVSAAVADELISEVRLRFYVFA